MTAPLTEADHRDTTTNGAVRALVGKSITFSANARIGQGGQGEFLRGMVRALDGLERGRARIFSREAQARIAGCVNLDFAGTMRRRLFDLIGAMPLVRGRRDWLNLLSDVDFDERVAAAAETGDVDLFDGVSGQCCRTLESLKSRASDTRLVVTGLNTHLAHMSRVVSEEHERIGSHGRSHTHPRMLQRARREIELADRVRVCSQLARRTFIEQGIAESKVHVVQVGIDLNHFRPVPPRADANDVFRVLVVSSIEPRKGVHYVLDAFEQSHLPNAELIIIGGTGDSWSRRMLESYLHGSAGKVRQVHMDVTTAPVEQSYGAASVLVHAAVEDGYGLVIPQALACGRPVIATRQSGAAELIEDGVNGFVIESRDVNALADRMKLLSTDRALLRRMSETAPAAVSRLGYEAYAAQVLNFYADVLGG